MARVELAQAYAHHPLKVACLPFHHIRFSVWDCKDTSILYNCKLFFDLLLKVAISPEKAPDLFLFFPPDGLGNAKEGAADTKAAVRVEAAGGIGPDAPGGVIDLAAPALLLRIVFQALHDYNSVARDITEGFVRILGIEAKIAVTVKAVLYP